MSYALLGVAACMAFDPQKAAARNPRTRTFCPLSDFPKPGDPGWPNEDSLHEMLNELYALEQNRKMNAEQNIRKLPEAMQKNAKAEETAMQEMFIAKRREFIDDYLVLSPQLIKIEEEKNAKLSEVKKSIRHKWRKRKELKRVERDIDSEFLMKKNCLIEDFLKEKVNGGAQEFARRLV